MKKLLSIILMAATVMSVKAVSLEELNLKSRLHYGQEFTEGERMPDLSGFSLDYVFFDLSANLCDGLTFTYNQNLSNLFDYGFWGSLEQLKLNYDINDNWSISAGKMFNLMGGWEMDKEDIDHYAVSEFWNNSEIFTPGIEVDYNFNNETDALCLQVTQSPLLGYYTWGRDLMGYNLMWYGEHDWFQTAYSFNVFGYDKAKYENLITLGNRFDFEDFVLELDITSRADMEDYSLFKSFSIVADAKYNFEYLTLGLKYSFDYNDNVNDMYIMPGTSIHYATAQAEYKPFKNYQDLRLYAAVTTSFGKYDVDNSGVIYEPKTIRAMVGLNWNVDFLNMFNK